MRNLTFHQTWKPLTNQSNFSSNKKHIISQDVFSERLFELPFWNLSLLRYIIYIYTYGSYLFFSSGGNCSLATFLKPSKPASHGKIWRSIERWVYKYLPCYATLKRKPLCSKSSFFRCRFDLVFCFFWKKILLICWHLASLESTFKRHDGMTRFSNHPSPPNANAPSAPQIWPWLLIIWLMLLGKATKHHKTIQPQQQQQQQQPQQPPSNYLPIFAFSFPYSILNRTFHHGLIQKLHEGFGRWGSHLRKASVARWMWKNGFGAKHLPSVRGTHDRSLSDRKMMFKLLLHKNRPWEMGIHGNSLRLIRIDLFLNDWTFWTRI